MDRRWRCNRPMREKRYLPPPPPLASHWCSVANQIFNILIAGIIHNSFQTYSFKLGNTKIIYLFIKCNPQIISIQFASNIHFQLGFEIHYLFVSVFSTKFFFFGSLLTVLFFLSSPAFSISSIKWSILLYGPKMSAIDLTLRKFAWSLFQNVDIQI